MKLYSTITDAKINRGQKRGRSSELLEKRNERLFYRYCYYAKILELRNDIVLQKLSDDFLITESSIIQLLQKNANRVIEISKQQLDENILSGLFPQLNWTIKLIK